MEFQPRHQHPFSYAEAVKLEIPTITQEITRLQNSLIHLERTNIELSEYIEATSDADAELRDALSENLVVIASQRERILMLSMVLVQKGASSGTAHYTIPANVSTTSTISSVHATVPNGSEDPRNPPNIRDPISNQSQANSDRPQTNQTVHAVDEEAPLDEAADLGVYL